MPEIAENLALTLNKLEKWYSQRKGSIVAFSGGIDSTLVLFLARKYQGKSNAIGVISNSESLKKKDFELAQSVCRDFDIHLEVIKTNELEDERYNRNPVDRCYFCKEHLYSDLSKIVEKYPDFDVLNGTNFDDFGDYRPGLKAAAKFRINSPMADCEVSKEELRQIARYFNLPNWDKPASPCLSSRIPYHHAVTNKKLRQIEDAENMLNEMGFSNVRVRHYDTYGKIEVPKEELAQLFLLQDKVTKKFSALGFEECVIDTEGLVSGKLNRAIKDVVSKSN
ncbi:ATP-dependent sacrificial sulfur transferase LarE [Mariniphaga sediminis]|uniref:ATP-dependent sacrificial sulfur transferase LarE n=1 Tax=Mariniphaga sediminis TaxID=1628158 RepID=A0A399D471_9BACT|nr:ATP-dependent sacrificial sulfur transferase LarE [Mariniphaga sediminis]RIH66714.1 ATP-dependent sacrificial sulfur transferase LarE [Mariniphaga sediminis]